MSPGAARHDHVDLVFVDELARLVDGALGRRLVVFDEQFDLAPANAVGSVEFGGGELVAIEQRLAEDRLQPGDRDRQADLDGVGGAQDRRCADHEPLHRRRFDGVVVVEEQRDVGVARCKTRDKCGEHHIELRDRARLEGKVEFGRVLDEMAQRADQMR